MTAPDVNVQTNITGKAIDVWSAVADPRRITEWSPESASVRCELEGTLPVGATFSGSNRNGRRQWSTKCRVIESEPGRAFAFDVTFKGMAVARWRYEITDGPDGVCVEEQWRKLSTLLRQFGGEFQVFVAFSSSGLLIHVVVGSCGGVGGLDTNRSGCDWNAASKVAARCRRTSSAVP